MKLTRKYNTFGYRVLQHTLFWLVSYYVLIHLFTSSGEIQKIDFIYTALFLFCLLPGVYLNLFILIPNLLSRKKFFFYGLAILIVIATTTELNILFFDKLVDYILPGYYFISYYEYIDIVKFVVTFISITSLIKLAKSWFELSETTRKYSELQKEKVEVELKALRAQVNPHFLFNSLNVLYSLAIKNSNESPNAIIKLADILRYVIYNSNRDFNPIAEEVKLINDYLDLQKFRIDSSSTVEFKFDITDENILIAPMLFLPLVENSFKHGVKGDINKTYVTINLKAGTEEICFDIENNKCVSEQHYNNDYSGIGLSNIKNRLNLVYPGRHVLEIIEDDIFFRIKLIIRNEAYVHTS